VHVLLAAAEQISREEGGTQIHMIEDGQPEGRVEAGSRSVLTTKERRRLTHRNNGPVRRQMLHAADQGKADQSIRHDGVAVLHPLMAIYGMNQEMMGPLPMVKAELVTACAKIKPDFSERGGGCYI
jgi:hypothetical protein